MIFKRPYLLLNSILEGDDGGTTTTSTTDTTDGGDGDSTGGGDSTNNTSTDNNSIELPEFMKDWGLDDDVAKDPIIQDFKSPADLAKSYVHAKKYIGKDKIALPNKHATKEEWDEIFTKLGRPEEADKYDIQIDKEKSAIDENFLGEFKAKAHNIGLLPHQAQELVDFYNTKIASEGEALLKQIETEDETAKQELKDEWGDSYDAQVGYAKYALTEFGSDKTVEALKTAGVASNPELVRLLAKVGKELSGDAAPGMKEKTSGGMTPQQAMDELDNIRGNPTHPLNIEDHPGHEAALREQEKLAKLAYSAKIS